MATWVSSLFGSVLVVKTHQTPPHTTLRCQGVEKSKKNQSVLTQHEETARLPSRIDFSDCPCSFLVDRVDPGLFSQNDHHSHLQRLVRSQEPLTLSQNSIGRLRGDVRPENCSIRHFKNPPGFPKHPSNLRKATRAVRTDPFSLRCPVESESLFRVCSTQNTRNQIQQWSNPTFTVPSLIPGLVEETDLNPNDQRGSRVSFEKSMREIVESGLKRTLETRNKSRKPTAIPKRKEPKVPRPYSGQERSLYLDEIHF
ncbi:hypothetical protein CRG98_012490 [Punica granatum]|uniref:Uncharacterized protein n=1 Tax=Punica granatum TaxID=22663 RepID=A0A2I0KF39_PUNGR|nr:hypothetical protein CRG98_012490 [Punica granatum]